MMSGAVGFWLFGLPLGLALWVGLVFVTILFFKATRD